MKKNLNKPRNCPPIGAHTSIAGGIYRALERGAAIDADVVQIFSKNQRQWQAKPLTTDEIDRFFQYQQNTGVRVACIHTSYLINIAAPAAETYRKSLEALQDEILRAGQLRVPNLVLHPGSYVAGSPAEGIQRVVRTLQRVGDVATRYGVTILLETTAGQGTQLGRTLEELAEMLQGAGNTAPLGVCLDTCHLFAAGYNINTPEGWEQFKLQLEATVGLAAVQVVHVNDSRMPAGSHRDRHARIGAGHIGQAGFLPLLNDPDFQAIPHVLEIPGGESAYAEDIAVLRTLCR